MSVGGMNIFVTSREGAHWVVLVPECVECKTATWVVGVFNDEALATAAARRATGVQEHVVEVWPVPGINVEVAWDG